MSEEIEKLFCYKGMDILIKKRQGEYQMGIGSPKGLDIWLEQGVYHSIKLVRTSGREYARIIIDKMLLSRKKGL